MKRSRLEYRNSGNAVIKFFLFLVSPALGFLGSVKSMNSRSSFLVFFLFSVLFGLCFITEDAKSDQYSLDSAAYRYRFEQYRSYSDYDLKDFFREFKQQYTSSGRRETRDIYVVTMAFLSSRISSNYHVFFALLSTVMAIFQLLSLKFLVKEEAFKGTLICILLSYFFMRSNGIFNINACRFATASWVAIYCNFQIFRNGNKRYLLLALITPLIHLSYWFYLIVLLLVLLSSSFLRFWKIALFASFAASSIAIQFVSDVSPYLPANIQGMIEMYTNDIDTRNNLYQILRRVFNVIEHGFLVYIMLLFMRSERIIAQKPCAKRVYEFLLVWLSIMFFVLPIPSLCERFLLLAMPMIAYLWLVVFEANGLYRNVMRVFPLVFIFSIYEEVNAYLFWSVAPEFWYTSPIYLTYKYLLAASI